MTVRHGCGQLFHSSWSENLVYSSSSNQCDFCCFSQGALHSIHNPCSHRCAVRWAYAMPMCVLFVSSRSGIILNPSAVAITDHSQSAKDIYPYFKYQLYVEDPDHRKSLLILPNGLNKPGERVHN